MFPQKRRTQLRRRSRLRQEAALGPGAGIGGGGRYILSGCDLFGGLRTEGFSLYSGLKEGKYFYSVGATVESVFSKNVWTLEDGSKVPLLDAMAKESCGKIYVMLGVNELGWVKVETFQNQYAKVIDRLREDHPDAQIVLQSILPVVPSRMQKRPM